jgi:FSR family fosmidomycin resistance protein-like MFS transporter
MGYSPERSARLSLVFSCLGHAYMHMFAAFYFVIVLALEKSWAMPYHELVELWTVGALLIGLAALPAGWLGDRWSATGMMIVFFIGMGAAAIFCGLVDGPVAMLVGLSAIGLFASIYHPVGIAMVVKNAKSRGKALGINGIFGGIGIACAGVVAGGLIDMAGWRAAFIVPGVVSTLTGFVLLAMVGFGMVKETTIDRKPEPQPNRSDMLRTYMVLLVTMVCMGLIFQASQAALPKLFDLRLRDVAGDGTLGIGLVVTVVYTTAAVFQYLGGHFADRYPLKPIYVGGFVFQIGALVLIASLAGLPLIAVAMVSVMLSTGVLPAENMLLARYTPERHRSLAFGMKFVLSFGSAPLALLLVSTIQEATGEFTWMFLALAGLAITAFGASVMLPGGRARAPLPAPAE